MNDTQLLEAIIRKLDNMESTLTDHSQQLKIIKEQTARNAELESTVSTLYKQVDEMKTDVAVIKKAISN